MKKTTETTTADTKTPERKRLQVLCTPKQEEIINKAVEVSGATDRSAWMLAHCLRAANGSSEGSPLMITGDLADRIRASAAEQGVQPEEIVRQWSIVGGA